MSFEPERLDDDDTRGSVDGAAMLLALATAGAQVRRSTTATEESGVLSWGPPDRPRAILIAAMGADDIVTDVVRMLAQQGSPVGVVAAPNLPLPGWVGPLDLVIAISLSGRARGPQQLAAEAGRRGAAVLSVGAADSPLEQVTALVRGIHVAVPTAGLSSRSAAWSLITPVVLALGALGVLPLDAADLAAAADRLDTQAEAARPSSESFVNPAKVLALDLAGRIPMVLGDGPLTAVAARRAGAMLARTARTPALTGELPDTASALLACLDGPFAATRKAPDGGRDIFADPELDPPGTELALVAIRDVVGDPPTPAEAARHNLAQGLIDLARDSGAAVHEITPAPGPDLVRLADVIALLDFTATYLAIGHGFDPRHSVYVDRLRDSSG